MRSTSDHSSAPPAPRGFDPAARHAQIAQLGDAAAQAAKVLRDKRLFELDARDWQSFLLHFTEEVLDEVDKLRRAEETGEQFKTLLAGTACSKDLLQCS